MTMWEYESNVFDISVAADRLTAVIALLNEHYFEKASNWPDSVADQAWWCSSYEDIQGVMGAVLTMSYDMKKALGALTLETVDKVVAV